MFAYTKIMQGIQAVSTAVTDAYFNLVTLLLNTSSTNGAQNNTFLDSSTNNFTITRNGNTTQGTFTPFSQTGWSNYFDGSSWISVPDSTDLDLASGTSWTMEAWVYNTGSSGIQNIMGSQNSAGDVNFLIGIGASNELKVVWSNSTPTAYTVSAPTAITRNTWIHVAAVNNAGTLSLYVNGTSVGTPQSISGSFRNLSSVVAVGRSGDYASQYWVGYISNARIVNGTALYTSNFTPSTTPLTDVTNTKLLTCQSNRFIDTNTQVSAKTITVGGTPSVQAFSPFLPTTAYDTAVVGGSGYFDGTGDYLTAASNSAFSFGTGSFTIEFWYYPRAALLNSGIVDTRGAGPTTSGVLIRQGDNASNANIIYAYVGDAGASTPATQTGLQINAWNYIAVVRDSSNNLQVYVNGSRGSQVARSFNITDSSFTLGAFVNASGSPNATNGYVTDFRILKGTAQYSGTTMTVPTAPLTAITNTSLLLNYTNAGIYDSASKNVLETVGNAQVSTTQAKWGTTSMKFDGTGDAVQIPNNQLYNFGTGDFTIECWLYPTASSVGTIIAKRSGSNTAWLQLYYDSTNKIGVVISFDGSTWGINSVGTTNVPLNAWVHVALVRNGSSFKTYINGTADISATNSGSINFPSDPVTVGAGATSGIQVLTGYLDDLRITRYARYTANFTAPTAAFPVQ